MRTVPTKPILGCLLMSLISCAFAGTLVADDWDPNDDTFDPTIKSVVIGDRSWIGDPSPFVLAGSTGPSRTGYTHVNATNFEGFPPAVQISLMIPQVVGNPQAPLGAMLMFDKDQTAKVIKTLNGAIKADKKDPQKRIEIKTSLPGAEWILVTVADKGQRFLQFENKTKEKTDKYRFSINASKKLLGAVQHSLKSLESKADK